MSATGRENAIVGVPKPIGAKDLPPDWHWQYAVRKDTVIRAGYGIFYDWANPPGFTWGIAQDGYNVSPSFGSSVGGMVAVFPFSSGLPQNFTKPPTIDPTFDNGQTGPIYGPAEADRLPYSQEWNLTVDHQFTYDFYLSAAYVGNKGTPPPDHNPRSS